ncbi:MAG: hypothetical protein DRQ52_03400 [Gammaproteobacteria bacterium]|nr:MAG: hypothetical protein DRQ52_03400 [Gammaproteobacteria bacterium]
MTASGLQQLESGELVNALPPASMLQEYRIDQVLGAGAFGITYRGTDTHLSIPVAIKEFLPGDLVHRGPTGQLALNAEEHRKVFRWARERFIGEAQVLAQFRHQNIVRASRYFTANGTAYIVMDYAEGSSLFGCSDWHGQDPDERRLIKIIRQILEGLKEVHRKKYLHLDIKPGNIYLRTDDTAMLIDFGAARMEIGQSTEEIVNLVTPGYSPPEQYNPHSSLGPPADIYALGATLYRLIGENRPLSAKKRLAGFQAHGHDPLIPAIERGCNRFSLQLLEMIDTMLILDVGARIQTIDQVLELLPGTVHQPTTASPSPRATVQHKVVFAGPSGAGKTTLVHTLSDIPAVTTDVNAGDITLKRKDETLVAMDYGLMELGNGERLHLYGAPGQERFDFTWEILRNGALGLVLLIDNSGRDPFADLDLFLHTFGEFIADAGLVIGVTRMDLRSSPTIEDYYEHLKTRGQLPCLPPVLTVDARDKQDVAMLVQALLISIDPGVED